MCWKEPKGSWTSGGFEGKGGHTVVTQFPHDRRDRHRQFGKSFHPLKNQEPMPTEHVHRFRDLFEIRRMGHAHHLRVRSRGIEQPGDLMEQVLGSQLLAQRQ